MIYELIVKLFGAGIAGLIQFLPFTINYDAVVSSLKIEATLTTPITKETQRLVENGVPLRIQYDWSLIVNDVRAYHQTVLHEFQFAKNMWIIDNVVQNVSIEELQMQMGSAIMILPGLRFDDGDRLTVFIKATILPDSTFTRSTRMSTDVLWNYYIPKHKEQLIYSGERFIPE
jgi:hypothetical protein